MTASSDSNTDPPDTTPETVICDRCGAPDALRVGSHHLCLNCYTTAGDCCHEAID